MSKAAFLDRDGVLNRKAASGGYITCWEEMYLLPHVAEALILLNESGFRVIVVTNQRCVSKGLISGRRLEDMHERMCGELATQGARIDGVYYCPHDIDARCFCRKPAPGMLLTAARKHNIDLTLSWMIGDSDIDVEAGKNAGCGTARVLGKRETTRLNSDIAGSSLLDIVKKLLGCKSAGPRSIQNPLT